MAEFFTYLLLPLVLSPFIGEEALALFYSRSWVSLFVVPVGAIAGIFSILFSGLFWLHLLAREWIQSQAVGFIFVPVILPFYAYVGAVTGASLVAILYGYGSNHFFTLGFFILAVIFVTVLGGLMPLAIAALSNLPNFAVEATGADPNGFDNFIVIPIVAIICGVASAWLGSKLAYLLVGR